MRCSRSATPAVLCCSIDCTRRSRSACSRSMRWKADSAPRRRSSRPASSAVTCAASCCNPSRFCRNRANCACNSSNPASAVRCSSSRRRVSSRLVSMMARLASRASLLRAACTVQSCSRRSTRWVSASICFNDAPWSAVSRSASRRSSLRASSCATRSSMVSVSAAASASASAREVSSLPRRLSASRSSRFSARGPSLAGLPPVTVALWKHSPPGVRKNACVCRPARRSASPASSTR